MIWLVIAIVVVLVLVIALAVAVGFHKAPSDAATYRAAVDLHAIRRRQEVAQFKSEVKRDAASARRELRKELGELNKRGRP
jgi:uncharacterized protein YpuA (DUF1002 family)